MARKEAIEAVKQAIASLPEDQRFAVELHFLLGLSIAATCESMRRTEGAVRGLVGRAKKSMRVSLGRSSRWFPKR
jgi:DNA-directed RNA polymerase specialized sigma24 family protein